MSKYVKNSIDIRSLIGEEVIFNEENHSYVNRDGEEYVSVSTFIKRLSLPFEEKDAFLNASDALKQEWKQKALVAAKRGKFLHSVLEKDWNGEVIEGCDRAFLEVIESINLMYKDYSAVFNEVMLYNHLYKIAGTADRIMITRDGQAEIVDFKTNCKLDRDGNVLGITFWSDYNDKLYAPLNHLDDCDYTRYTLQLSLYAFLFEQLTNIQVRRVYIHWIPYYDPRLHRVYPTIYLKNDVRLLLERLNSLVTNDVSEF